MLVKRRIAAFLVLVIVVVLAAAPFAFSASASVAFLALSPIALTPGATLNVSCSSALSGSWLPQSAALSCAALTSTNTPTPVPTGTATPISTATKTITPTPTITPTAPAMRQGFDLNGGSVVGDLALTHGSVYINFASPLNPPVATEVAAGVATIRVLRYADSCPGDVDFGCTQTIANLATFAATFPGGWYETGNEPNPSGRANSGQDDLDAGFTTWQNSVYTAIKTADPSATVDGPGSLDWNDPGLATGLATGQGAVLYTRPLLYDHIALHLYPDDNIGCGGSAWIAMDQAQITGAEAFASGRPVDVTEMGEYFPWCAGVGYTGITSAFRESNIQAVVDFARSSGIRTMIWYLNRDVTAGSSCNTTWASPTPVVVPCTGWLVGSATTPTDNTLQPEAQGWIQ